VPVAQLLVEQPWAQPAGVRPTVLAFRYLIRKRLKPEADWLQPDADLMACCGSRQARLASMLFEDSPSLLH
jgi:hypothetical protein